MIFVAIVMGWSACSDDDSADVCAGVTCSSHGTCKKQDSAPVCSCDQGYVALGLSCIEEHAPSCGDNHADPGEDCDGTDLAGRSCKTMGYEGGQLACNEDCTFDVSACSCDDGDGLDCTQGRLTGGDCEPVLQNGWCLIDGICVEEGSVSTDSECRQCLPETNDHEWTILDAVACDNEHGVCVQGSCKPDQDGDQVADEADNCPTQANGNQADSDNDGRGDACDNCPTRANADQVDSDNDGKGDVCDNCPSLANGNQADSDNDGTGDMCQVASLAETGGDGNHACLVTEAGQVWCWGNNQDGQLGDGTTDDASTPHPVVMADDSPFEEAAMVTVGAHHTCAVKTDGTVWCWGYNYYHQLGDGTTESRLHPVQVQWDTSTPVTDASWVSAGNHHTCLLRQDNRVWCWGYNGAGRLGNGTDEDSAYPVSVLVAAGQALSQVAELTVGGYHSCALTLDGHVWCWGYNDAGQVGDGTSTSRNMATEVLTGQGAPLALVQEVDCGGRKHSCARTATSVYCWGLNQSGQLGDGTRTNRLYATATGLSSLSAPTHLSAGGIHSCTALADGTALCWGSNWYYQSGGSSQTVQTRPIQIQADNTAAAFSNISTLTAFGKTTCALLEDHSVWCWGDNSFGELGAGDSMTEATSMYPVPLQFP